MENVIDTKPKKTEQRHTRDMTEGSIYRHMLAFALPILLSQVFQQLYNTCDAFIVGQLLGTSALAAVSSSGPLIHLMISFFVGISMGAGTVIARYFGAGDPDKVSKAIHTNLAFGLIASAVLTTVGVVFTPTLLRWINTDPQVMPEAVSYFRWYFSGISTIVMYNMCKGIMNAVGDSRRPLYYLIYSSLLNVVLDVVFIGVFKWGVWSAAFATVLSQASALVLCLFHILKKGRIFSVYISRIRIHKEVFGEIVRIGLPSGVQNSVIGLANVVVQSQINSFGMIAMAAYGAHSKVEGFAFLPIMSFNMAISTFISQNLGAKKYDRAKKGARFGIILAVGLAQCIGFAVLAFAPQLVSIFDDTPEVVALGALQARTLAKFYFLLSFSHSVAAVCRGAGKAFVPMTVMLGVWCVIRLIYIYLIMHFVGDIALIYWAYPITWMISSVIYLFYYLFSDWVHGFEHVKKRPLLRKGA
ncbi:MAG: MATE family efflux transporter [Oscillospiraceae bacterium]|nr:MATE family efflux transporter [Oscillospiraceae bacterium]